MADKWRFIHDGLSRFAGRRLPLNDEVYASASETNYRNQSIARLLQSFGRIYMDPAEATDLYTKQCSLNVSAKDLAVMGATLADGGVNPLTKERVVDAGRLPLRTGGDDDGRAVRDVWRLALRRRPAGQERHRRRDRHGVARQGRTGDVRPAARSRPAIASRGSSWPSSCRSGWGWTCSFHSRRVDRQKTCGRDAP